MVQIQFSFEDPNPIGLTATNLVKIYDDPATESGILALRGIEFSATAGSLVSIIGPSGAGKSTLLNIFGGMIKPSAGQVYVGDLPLHELTREVRDEYHRKIAGFLWQLPEKNLLPALSVEENIEFAQRIAGYPRKRRNDQIAMLLQSVGLTARKNYRLGQLSGGEAQRAGLAVALANEPKILFADEPTGELDSETTFEIIGFLQDLNKDLGTTMIVVTHDNRFERLTNQSYRILDGQISGVRRAMHKITDTNWKSTQREELAYVDRLGNVQIPDDIRIRHHIEKYVRFVSDGNKLYIEPADKEEQK